MWIKLFWPNHNARKFDTWFTVSRTTVYRVVKKPRRTVVIFLKIIRLNGKFCTKS